MPIETAITGALSGAAAGGVPGAVFGGLAGVLGSDDSTKTTVQLRDLTPGEQNILAQIERQMPGLLDSLDPAQVQELAKEFSANFAEEGLRQVGDVFSKRQENLRLDQVRTGGVLGTVGAEQSGRLGREEGIARSSVISSANVAGQNVAQQVLAGNQRSVGALQGVSSSIYGSQAIGAGTTTTNPGGLQNDLLAGGLSASIQNSDQIMSGLKDLLGGI